MPFGLYLPINCRMAASTLHQDRKKLIRSFRFPLLIVLLAWLVKLMELATQADFHHLGVLPMTLEGIRGIFTAPLIHGDFKHLFANSGPLLFLGAGIGYFFPQKKFSIWLMAWFFTGFLVWLAGRESYHIGASGIVYCFASFLFFSGIIKRNTPLMAISLLVAFLYGGMFWGILPTKPQISWEAHLMGFLVGIVAAYRFRHFGPQRHQYPWENDEDDDDPEPFQSDNSLNSSDVHYHYRED